MKETSASVGSKPRRLAVRRGAAPRAAGGVAPGGASPFVPDSHDLAVLARAVQKCRGCDLYRHATQAVFGEGSPRARLVLVGEQPGDQEDLQGRPFVGPAGAILDKALAEAGIPRKDVFVTNAVKHFKFERTPKRRIHQTPTSGEVQACKPWLFGELEVVKPDVLVCLGATASKAVIGPAFRLLRQRGEFVPSPLAARVIATYHPSAALRVDTDENREKIYGFLVKDLKKAAAAAR